MKIGIDATCWSNWRGFGRFTRSLVPAILQIDSSNDYILFFDSSYERCRDLPERARHVRVPTAVAQEDAIGPDSRRTVADVLRMTRAVSNEKLDLFFSPSIDSYFPIINVPRKILAVYDANLDEMPELVLPSRRARFFRRMKMRAALRQADLLVTGSSYSRAQISSVLHWPGERIRIVPGGADPIFRPPALKDAPHTSVKDRHGVVPPYFLYVGGAGGTKNLAALASGFAEVADEARLIVVGKPDSSGELQGLAERFGDRARFLGFQPDEGLVTLYQRAEALVVPALKEGYGLPAVEAVSCGTPAIVTTASPLPEILGDAAIAFDPRRPRDLAAAMKALLANSEIRDKSRAAALRLSGSFGWDRSARAAVEAFAEAAGAKRNRFVSAEA